VDGLVDGLDRPVPGVFFFFVFDLQRWARNRLRRSRINHDLLLEAVAMLASRNKKTPASNNHSVVVKSLR